jgi:cytochrome c oxidase subunit 2
MRVANLLKASATTLIGTTLASVAFAQENLGELETIGKPVDKLMGFQPAATELARDLQSYDYFLLWVITIITLFVTGLLLYAGFRFSAKRNPVPATFTHHTGIEIAWTLIPVLILLALIPTSLGVLFKQQEIPTADITIKATGNQWYWTHEYVDHEFGFDSFMLDKSALAEYGYAADEYLLATDTAVVVPVNKTIVVQVTASDVIHSWTIPAFGVKQDAVPGRLAELWFSAEKEGVYFGQCSELCGKDHSYMPITVKVVSQEKYDAWLAGAIEEYAGIPQAVKYADANFLKVEAAEKAVN